MASQSNSLFGIFFSWRITSTPVSTVSQGMLTEAIVTYNEAIAREPKFPEAYNNLVGFHIPIWEVDTSLTLLYLLSSARVTGNGEVCRSLHCRIARRR